MEIKKSFYEPLVEIEYIEAEVLLYTSVHGDDGDIWEVFDDTNW